jgi:hypothetical protein
VIGRFGFGRISTAETNDSGAGMPIVGTDERSLTDRLPADLQGTAADQHFEHPP